MRPALVALSCAALTGLAGSPPATAMPAFARRYQTPCTTCHAVIPKLNAFGIAFRNHGYRVPPNDRKFVRSPDLPLGAPGWKKLWPEAVWPGAIPGMPPLALRIASDVVVDPTARAKVDFVFPTELELMAGGTAGDSISYWAELEVTPGDRIDLARAFVQFDHLGGTTLANLIIGRYEPRAVPFSRFFRRLTLSDMITSEFRAVPEGFDFKQRQVGFELWGAQSGARGAGGLEYAIGIVNGNGPFSDNNTSKDLYYRVSYKLGGFGVTGSVEERDGLPEASTWRDDSVRLGSFGYLGKGLFAEREDEFWRVGADIDLFLRDLNVFGAVMRGRDRLTATGSETDFTAAFIEADYMVKPWVVASGRYDAVYRRTGSDVRRFVPAVIVAVRANLRIVAESEAYSGASGDSRGRIRIDLLF